MNKNKIDLKNMSKTEKYKTAIQGFFGSYTHETVDEIAEKFNLPIEAIEAPTFSDQFEAIEKNGFGLVPIENSNQGIVAPPLDLFREYDFEIIGEYFFKVNHTLLVNKGVKLEDVEKAYSHPQAVAQCSK
jgi:prephenate dehydratase